MKLFIALAETVDISVIFHEIDVIIPAFCHFIGIFKLCETLDGLLTDVETVETVVGLYP